MSQPERGHIRVLSSLHLQLNKDWAQLRRGVVAASLCSSLATHGQGAEVFPVPRRPAHALCPCRLIVFILLVGILGPAGPNRSPKPSPCLGGSRALRDE